MSKGLKIPKKVAGVKVPKMLRKGPVGEFVSSSAGQMMIAEAAALLIAAVTVRQTNGGNTVDVKHSIQRLSRAFEAAVAAFRESLGSDDDAPTDLEEEADEIVEEPAAKKSSASGSTVGSSTREMNRIDEQGI